MEHTKGKVAKFSCDGLQGPAKSHLTVWHEDTGSEYIIKHLTLNGERSKHIVAHMVKSCYLCGRECDVIDEIMKFKQLMLNTIHQPTNH